MLNLQQQAEETTRIKWTPETDAQLRALVEVHGDDDVIASMMGITYEAVRHRRVRLSLYRRRPEDSRNWTPELVARLTELWIAGMPISAMATELGNGFTRNSVVGKVHRLGLQNRERAKSVVKQKRKARSTPFRHRPLLYLAIDNTADDDTPLAQRKTIMELNENTCRWPVGDPQNVDFFYCGAESAGFTYCPKHTQAAHSTFKSFGEVASRVIEKLEAQMTHDNTQEN
jgi:GcrA cell cycle regulator